MILKASSRNKAPFTLLRFCTKTERTTFVFVKVFTLIRTKTPQKKKTEVFENAVKSGYPQKWRFLKNAFDQCECTKTEVFETLQYSTMSFTKPEQSERTKPDVFRCVCVIWQIDVNAQKRRLFSPFLYKNGAV